jgi:hypothetical protein
MKYLLPCKCGQSVEVEPGQAGQTVVCNCGELLIVPSMLQVKALPAAPEKPVLVRKKNHVPHRAALVTFILGIVCLGLFVSLFVFIRLVTIGFSFSAILLAFPPMLRGFMNAFFLLRSIESGIFFMIFLRGLMWGFLCTSIALAVRNWTKSPLAEDTAIRRSFFVLGAALLFPAFLLASYLHECKPVPWHVLTKRTLFSYGSNKKPLYQDSTPISEAERRILWMTDERIDQMAPMDLYFYFRTLEQPTFSYDFQDNYQAIKDTYRIWVIGNIILGILSILSIVVSFFMPRQTIVVSGWSGSEWR